MNRQEAVGIVSEVLSGCRCFLESTHISITASIAQIRMKSTGYEVYIKRFPNDDLRECIAPILARHQLKMAELSNAVVIYKPKTD